MKLTTHPIQLIDVSVNEIHIKLNKFAGAISPDEVPGLKYFSAHSAYDPDDKTIAVILSCKTQEENIDEFQVDLRVSIIGFFKIVDDSFPIDRIEDWADRNAPFILHPYLREQVHSLTRRTGIPPIIIPLHTVPTFAVQEKQLDVGDKPSLDT